MPKGYYSLDGAYSEESLKNTPSEYENLRYPCLDRYPEDPSRLNPYRETVDPVQRWDFNYGSVVDAYRVKRPYTQFTPVPQEKKK